MREYDEIRSKIAKELKTQKRFVALLEGDDEAIMCRVKGKEYIARFDNGLCYRVEEQ